MEEHTALDYLNDIMVGGASRRWQTAFELSKILNVPNAIPKDQRFVSEMVITFRHAEYDDNKVRQYLALAMGRTGNAHFVDPLIEALPKEKEDNLPAIRHFFLLTDFFFFLSRVV